GLALRRGVSLPAILPALERVLDAACWRERRLLLGVGNVASGELPTWRARGYAASPQSPDMILELPGEGYEAYLDGLTKKDRAELRRIRRRGAELGVTFGLGS